MTNGADMTVPGGRGYLERRNETISAAGNCFDVSGLLGRIPQHLPESVHRRIQAMFKINERAALPQLLLKFLATDNLPGLPEQT